MKKDLRPFIRQCLLDEEFWLSGGIPEKEEYYINKLDLNRNDLHKFYDAMCKLQNLSMELNKR